MKIECPECGQHYEVDSSMLDRHFRCTECKTFFLGINAKTVKVKKYVPKSTVAAQEGAPDTAPAEDAAAATADVAAEPPETDTKAVVVKDEPAAAEHSSSDTVLLNPDKDAAKGVFDEVDTAAPAVYPKVKLILAGVIIAFVVLTAVVSAAVAWAVNLQSRNRIEELEKRNRALLQNDNILLERIEKLEAAAGNVDSQFAAANEKSVRLEKKITVLEGNQSRFNEITERINKLDSKDLELNVKILELNNLVNELKDLIEDSDRSGSRVQRKRR